MDFNKDLIDKVRELKGNGTIRRDADIVERTGFSKSVVSSYLNGKIQASRNFMDKFNEVFKMQTLKTNATAKQVPYLRDIDALGGSNAMNMDVSEYIDEYISVPFFSKADYYVNVRGDSMYGRYRAGDIIAIKEIKDREEIQYGQVYVVVTAENRVLKYVRKGDSAETIRLLSENPKFDPYEVKRKNVRAMFLVLGKITKDVL